jgi:hypothetical protein
VHHGLDWRGGCIEAARLNIANPDIEPTRLPISYIRFHDFRRRAVIFLRQILRADLAHCVVRAIKHRTCVVVRCESNLRIDDVVSYHSVMILIVDAGMTVRRLSTWGLPYAATWREVANARTIVGRSRRFKYSWLASDAKGRLSMSQQIVCRQRCLPMQEVVDITLCRTFPMHARRCQGLAKLSVKRIVRRLRKRRSVGSPLDSDAGSTARCKSTQPAAPISEFPKVQKSIVEKEIMLRHVKISTS